MLPVDHLPRKRDPLDARLAEAGADPVRLRELTASEAAEYLAGFLAKLAKLN